MARGFRRRTAVVCASSRLVSIRCHSGNVWRFPTGNSQRKGKGSAGNSLLKWRFSLNNDVQAPLISLGAAVRKFHHIGAERSGCRLEASGPQVWFYEQECRSHHTERDSEICF